MEVSNYVGNQVGLERIEIEQAEICRLHDIHFECLGIRASSQ
jgi:hypothetical protein